MRLNGQNCPKDRSGGFVMLFVVMMLFAISVAGATGYMLVSSEFNMARHSSEGAEALSAARAGLHRFVAEQYGVVPDTVWYAIGNGIVAVTTRKLMEADSVTDIYTIRSRAEVYGGPAGTVPAMRVVGSYAIRHRRPLAHHAALMITEEEIELESGGEAFGVDSSTVVDCPGGGATPITGIVALSDVDVQTTDGGYAEGNPIGELWGTYQAFYDSVALRWDVLSDPNFPVEYEDFHPNFTTMPIDSFPVVRYNGDQYFTNAHDGWGVLIVSGEFDADSNFDWSGIVLSGEVDAMVHGQYRGMFVGGLNGPNPTALDEVEWRGQALYYSCHVYAANESLAYLELIDNTLFEAN